MRHPFLTESQTSWGSREDGDEHNTFRLQEKPRRSQSMATPPYGPDLPKAIKYPKLSQPRRVAAYSEKRELIGCMSPAAEVPYQQTAKLTVH